MLPCTPWASISQEHAKALQPCMCTHCCAGMLRRLPYHGGIYQALTRHLILNEWLLSCSSLT